MKVMIVKELMTGDVSPVAMFGRIMSSHHSDQMSKRSQVHRNAPLGCSLIEVHR